MLSNLGAKWLDAAKDLGIRVTAPFVLRLQDGLTFDWDALIHDFGSPNGMLVMNEWSSRLSAAATQAGYGFSCMASAHYDRDSIIEVLIDWGWNGDESRRPSWCTVEPSEEGDS